jgi:NAD(P)-dependent dehydrogenase (short-subunit alcohol dehydrogenase family)
MVSTLLVFGARNLGRAIAEHFAEQGSNVAGAARGEDSLELFADSFPDGLSIQGDASDPAFAAAACARTRERFGSLDVIVNASSPGMRTQGRFGGGPLLEATKEDYVHYGTGVIDIAFAFLSEGAKALNEAGNGGTLVQITGGSSRRAMPGKGPWAAGAFGTRALTQAASLELREHGIHAALLIVDATIRSPKTAAYTGDAPKDGLADQKDIARAVVFLQSQAPTAWTHELVITPRSDTWTP